MSNPIIDLIVWAYGGTMPDEEKLQTKLQTLESLPEAKMIQTLQEPNEPIGLPPLNAAEIEHLQEGTQRKREAVESRLRREIKQLLQNLKLSEPQTLADRVRARREARRGGQQTPAEPTEPAETSAEPAR